MKRISKNFYSNYSFKEYFHRQSNSMTTIQHVNFLNEFFIVLEFPSLRYVLFIHKSIPFVGRGGGSPKFWQETTFTAIPSTAISNQGTVIVQPKKGFLRLRNECRHYEGLKA